ncbi:MAG: hypothetical protein AAF957_11605 [Planctomycetota bacterium]
MRTQRSSADRSHAARSASLASALLVSSALSLLAGCGSSGDDGGFSGDLFIESCSLACSDGAGGAQVACSVVDVTENVEVSILFSRPIDAASLDATTLQVTDVANGTAPEGLRFVDPLDPRRVIFRPAIEFQGGGVSFAFQRNRAYEVRIPGFAQGDSGPFIRSQNGSQNTSRLVCTIFTSQGVADIVPGNPQVEVFVDVATEFDMNGFPTQGGLVRTQIGPTLANAVTDVARISSVFFEFNELMNIPTVANVVTGESLTIFVELDIDGDIATAGGDRVPIPGRFEVSVDQLALTTSAVFTPDDQIPSAGRDPMNPRLLIVRVTTAVSDIANNPVTSATGGGVLVAIPETLIFPTIFIEDGFDRPAGTTNPAGPTEDANVTGAQWGPDALQIGLTGGSGRHGSIFVPAGETVTLNTDMQEFPASVAQQTDVIGNGSGTSYPAMATVTDGVFELSSLVIEPLGRLVLTGSNPARVLVRGRCLVSAGGLIDASGNSAPPHDSSTPSTDNMDPNAPPPTLGGPNGANGGLGGDRQQFPASSNIIALGGLGPAENPDFRSRDGEDGQGVGLMPVGQGFGADGYPAVLPVSDVVDMTSTEDVGYSIGTDPLDPLAGDRCVVQQIGGSGSGGAYSEDGGAGTSFPLGDPQTGNPVFDIAPPTTPGGDSSGLGIEPPNLGNMGYLIRLLRWQDGNLRGGSSGGGGGNHPFATYNNSMGSPPVTVADCLGMFPVTIVTMVRWNDHSAASGGAGGGALEVLAGRQVELDGRVTVRGGDGGNALATAGQEGSFAMPGGAGAGGSLRIRSDLITIGPGAQVDADGGRGGSAPWSATMMGMQSRGGDGSPGLFRIEDGNADPMTQIDFDQIAGISLPFNPNDPNASISFLSVAPNYLNMNTVGTQRPDTLSGAASCWVRPEGNYLLLQFREDSTTDLSPAGKGWTMDLVVRDGMGGTRNRPFRGVTMDDPVEWEATFGNLLGYDLGMGEVASPVVVRFQGGRTRNVALMDECNTDINDVTEVLAGSLTPWVAHPADLNVVTDSAGVPFAPNMVRFCVIFDRTNDGMDTPGMILDTENVLGVDNMRIIADPD